MLFRSHVCREILRTFTLSTVLRPPHHRRRKEECTAEERTSLKENDRSWIFHLPRQNTSSLLRTTQCLDQFSRWYFFSVTAEDSRYLLYRLSIFSPFSPLKLLFHQPSWILPNNIYHRIASPVFAKCPPLMLSLAAQYGNGQCCVSRIPQRRFHSIQISLVSRWLTNLTFLRGNSASTSWQLCQKGRSMN